MFVSERDWQHLSHLKPLALERLCRRILDGAQSRITGVPEGESHRTYLDLYTDIFTNKTKSSPTASMIGAAPVRWSISSAGAYTASSPTKNLLDSARRRELR